MQRYFRIFITVIVIFWGTGIRLSAADVTINLLAVNGSEEAKKHSIKYYLPKEITPDDLIDTAGLKVDYDVDKGLYYVLGEVDLKEKESKTIKLTVKDVWRIDKEEIEILRQQINDNVAFLEGTEFYEAAQTLGEDMLSRLDYIVKQQENYSENIGRRIEEYRSYRNIFDQIRKNAFSSDYFASPFVPQAKEDTVTFVIEVKNPSEDEEKVFEQKHYLPKEIKSEHILDAQGFEVRYDADRQQPYLLKEETFKPGETKRYQIVIKDIWYIDDAKVDNLRDQVDRVMEELKGSDYEQSANFLFEKITANLERIQETQTSKEDMSKYIGSYRTNAKRLAQSEQDVERLEKLLAIVKAKKLKKLERSSVKNILQKLQSLRGIAAISKAIFGKKPSVNTTWRIIWGIMAFIALFTSVHFFTWWKRSKTMGEEGGVGSGEEIEEIGAAKEESLEEQEAET